MQTSCPTREKGNREAPQADVQACGASVCKRDPVGTSLRYFKSRFDTLNDFGFVIYY